MTKVFLEMSMSLDGYVAGPNVAAGNPLGNSGELLHRWMFDLATDADEEQRAQSFRRAGALIVGRTTFDVGEEPWGDPPPFHGLPMFVLTHEPLPPRAMSDGTVYTFIGDPRTALEAARAAAGIKDVGIWGGATIAQLFLELDLIDEMSIRHVPVLLGSGSKLFAEGRPRKLRKLLNLSTPGATHIHYSLRMASE